MVELGGRLYGQHSASYLVIDHTAYANNYAMALVDSIDDWLRPKDGDEDVDVHSAMEKTAIALGLAELPDFETFDQDYMNLDFLDLASLPLVGSEKSRFNKLNSPDASYFEASTSYLFGTAESKYYGDPFKEDLEGEEKRLLGDLFSVCNDGTSSQHSSLDITDNFERNGNQFSESHQNNSLLNAEQSSQSKAHHMNNDVSVSVNTSTNTYLEEEDGYAAAIDLIKVLSNNFDTLHDFDQHVSSLKKDITIQPISSISNQSSEFRNFLEPKLPTNEPEESDTTKKIKQTDDDEDEDYFVVVRNCPNAFVDNVKAKDEIGNIKLTHIDIHLKEPTSSYFDSLELKCFGNLVSSKNVAELLRQESIKSHNSPSILVVVRKNSAKKYTKIYISSTEIDKKGYFIQLRTCDTKSVASHLRKLNLERLICRKFGSKDSYRKLNSESEIKKSGEQFFGKISENYESSRKNNRLKRSSVPSVIELKENFRAQIFRRVAILNSSPSEFDFFEFENILRCLASQQNLYLNPIDAINQIKVDNGELYWLCPIVTCKFAFSKASTLKNHLARHLDEKPYKCHVENCSWSFRMPSGLKRHLISHDVNQKLFVCRIEGCNRKFNRASNLSRHLESKTHRVISKADSNRKMQRCGICEVKFVTKKDLSAHARKIHRKIS